MRTVDYLEDYLNGDDDTIHFESFHALRRHRNKLRATNDEDRKLSRIPKDRNRKASRLKERSQDETK